MYYPIFLDLRERDCLVVGGGIVGTGKVSGLLEAGARVTVVAPQISAQVTQWYADGRLVWHAREFLVEDLDDQFLVIAATNNKALNAFVYQLANRQQRVANAVDDLDNCNFIAPAIASSGAVQVAVSTAGKSPALAKQLRDHIQHDLLKPEIAGLAEFLGQWRPEVKRQLPTYPIRQAFWESVLASMVPELLAEGLPAAAEHAMQALLHTAHVAAIPHAHSGMEALADPCTESADTSIPKQAHRKVRGSF